MNRLPIKAAYTLSELAKALSVDRRTLRHILAYQGVETFGDSKLVLISIAEIERKLPSLFEGMKLVHSLLESIE